jgi:hypothetical protein
MSSTNSMVTNTEILIDFRDIFPSGMTIFHMRYEDVSSSSLLSEGV